MSVKCPTYFLNGAGSTISHIFLDLQFVDNVYVFSWHHLIPELKGQFAAKSLYLLVKKNMVPVKIFPYTILEYLRIAHQPIDRKQNIIKYQCFIGLVG